MGNTVISGAACAQMKGQSALCSSPSKMTDIVSWFLLPSPIKAKNDLGHSLWISVL